MRCPKPYALATSHARSSAIECTVASGASRVQPVRAVRAVGNGERRRAGVSRELDVVRRVADHQRFVRRDADPIHQPLEHVRMRLGQAFVGAARRREKLAEPLLRERAVETGARLARRDGEQEAGAPQARPAIRARPA